MNITMLYSKIHRATVTDANLNYVGSITIDQELLDAAKMRVGQKIDIVNVNNGERVFLPISSPVKQAKEISVLTVQRLERCTKVTRSSSSPTQR